MNHTHIKCFFFCFLTISAACFADVNTPAQNCLPYLPGKPNEASMLAPKINEKQAHETYVIPATPATTQWGVFNSQAQPILHVNSGDTVVFETMAASDNMVVPGGATAEQIYHMNIDVPGRGPHTLTGPVYINGAEPGDVLQIHINKIIPKPYASNDIMPGKGLFPNLFSKPLVRYFYLDLSKMQMTFSPGIVVPLAPFPGIMAVAQKTSGKFDSIPPGKFGGNLDLPILTVGSTLYLPVFKPGALLWTGDSHAKQGNGEIDLTALETAFAEISVTVNVIKNTQLDWPIAETKNDWVSMGYDDDLNKALTIATNEATKLIMNKFHTNHTEAEKILYQHWNCPISEVVDELSGVYCMIPKNKNAPAYVLPNADTTAEFVTIGKNKDAMQAMKAASLEMINRVSKLKHMKPVDVYMLSSFALDCRIAPYHSGDKVVHCMLPKSLWVK